MSCISRNTRTALVALTLTALLAAPLAAGAAPAERRAETAIGDGGWSDVLRTPWLAFQGLIESITGADGTEPPPPPPPEDDDPLLPPDPPACPNQHSGSPCVDPGG